jgi:hypothetical protein
MEELLKTSGVLYLIPAYGRSYTTSELAMQDWKAGKDFQIVKGPYCSIRDLKQMQKEITNKIYIVNGPGLTGTATLVK